MTGKGLSVEAGLIVADALRAGIDRQLVPWLDSAAIPDFRRIRRIVEVIAPMLSQQTAATLRRNRLSASQEGEVVVLLRRKGWEQQGSAPIAALDGIQRGHFMHKTKFATKTRPQEVDIACGLGKTVVLAMECKVTNDETNSVKRINDVLKKASAWHDHWVRSFRLRPCCKGLLHSKTSNASSKRRCMYFGHIISPNLSSGSTNKPAFDGRQ